MARRHRAVTAAFAGSAILGAALAGSATAWADPDAPEPTPVTTSPVAPPPPPPLVSSDPMTPRQPAVPVDPAAAPPPAPAAPGDPAAPPPDAPPVMRPSVPEIQNPTYGSGSGGGILGSLKDIWRQAQNPFADPRDVTGAGGTPIGPPPGAGPPPALPPGYVSITSPRPPTAGPDAGSGASDAGRPALPPGYYPIDGPPPPWYLDPSIPVPDPATAVPAS